MSFDLDPTVDVGLAEIVTLGGHQFKVPPLTLRKIIAVADMLPALSQPKEKTSEQINVLLDFVLLGLSRPYPNLTRDDLLETAATVAELRAAADVIVMQAGGKKVDAAGEAPAATGTAPSPGAGSPQSLSSN